LPPRPPSGSPKSPRGRKSPSHRGGRRTKKNLKNKNKKH
jgi:hypothetical protein